MLVVHNIQIQDIYEAACEIDYESMCRLRLVDNYGALGYDNRIEIEVEGKGIEHLVFWTDETIDDESYMFNYSQKSNLGQYGENECEWHVECHIDSIVNSAKGEFQYYDERVTLYQYVATLKWYALS